MIWRPSVPPERLLEADVAAKFLAGIVSTAKAAKLMSDDRGNPTVNFHGQKQPPPDSQVDGSANLRGFERRKSYLK